MVFSLITNELPSTESLALILYLLKLIDQNTYAKMSKTIKERNKLVHPVSQGEGIGYRDRKEEYKAIEILTDAKECIKELRLGITISAIGSSKKVKNPKS